MNIAGIKSKNVTEQAHYVILCLIVHTVKLNNNMLSYDSSLKASKPQCNRSPRKGTMHHRLIPDITYMYIPKEKKNT